MKYAVSAKREQEVLFLYAKFGIKDRHCSKLLSKIYNENMKKKVKKIKTKAVKEEVAICDRQFDCVKYGSLLKRYFAHRGVHGEYPENSLPAFNEAIERKYAIELDVHLSKDNHLVVFHDDNLHRLTGVDDFIKHKSLEEIKQLNLLDTQYKIPTLKEVLNLVAAKTPILLEIKTENNTKRICKAVIEELKDYNGDIFIQSFNSFVLRYFYKLAPNYLRGQLSSFFTNDTLGWIKKTLIKTLRLNKFAHVDFIAYNIKNLPNKYVNKTKVPVLTWSIKTHEEFLKAKKVSNNLIVDDFDCLIDKK